MKTLSTSVAPCTYSDNSCRVSLAVMLWAESSRKQSGHGPPCSKQWLSPCSLFRACAGLSVPLSSSGIDQNGTLANRVGLGGEENGGEELRLSPSFHFYCKIGLAFAWHLVQGGAYVVVSSRKQESMDSTVAVLQGDGLSPFMSPGPLEHCGGIDFLVCKAVISSLVGSTLGSSEQELGTYKISKTALPGLTRMLALELAPKDIYISCLVLRMTKKDFSKVVKVKVLVLVRLPCKSFLWKSQLKPKELMSFVFNLSEALRLRLASSNSI
ncbi:dehydrogenase/reductase SDR family member 2 isoform 2 [Camelus ferus]|nr:dehydrogenase/reductase SDR family member 2 isoform 2 [Camelus ferus]